MKAPKMRRSVSFAAVTFVRMWLHCHREGLKMAAYLDGLANADLDRCAAPTPTREQAHAAIIAIRGLKSVKTQASKLRAVLEAMKPAPKVVTQAEVLSGNGHYL